MHALLHFVWRYSTLLSRMKILLIGSGGREHALALKLKENKSVELFIAPGNPATEKLGINVPIQADQIQKLTKFAVENKIDMVAVGPEVPLCAGLADALYKEHILCFGPSKAASQIEGSKVFSKKLMVELGIPTATYSTFSNFEEAAKWINSHRINDYVIKKSGLAAGKGVFLPGSKYEAIGIAHELLKDINTEKNEILIEEKLYGEEISVLAFCDGTHYAVMPSSQDHKRIFDGDRGENTGGMGAYTPVPAYPLAETEKIAEKVIAPIVKHFAKCGTPYIGVLYAGIIITKEGAKVLEYNCRFGDPETQSLMSLFDGDLAQTMLDCCKGKLNNSTIRWKDGSAVGVVLANEGYPSGIIQDVPLLESQLSADADTLIIHSGTARKNGELLAHGGRVLTVVAHANSLPAAVKAAYARIEKITFPRCQYRRDIARRGLDFLANAQKSGAKSTAYSASGVDIDAGNKAVQLMAAAVKSTYTKAVLSDVGSFGGLFSCDELLQMREPVLVGSTDGVGTKVKLAAQVKSYRTIGMDIVNHCIDDILVQGAKPLFFLDYFATSKLDPFIVSEIVAGMSEACAENACALIGGETAEMPGVYLPGEFDIAGTIVGVVEKEKILPKADIRAGDVLVGLKSASPHTNGYSLIRKTFEHVPLDHVYPELGVSLEKALLTPHRSYLKTIYPILQKEPMLIKALAHITGGGFYENIPRVLPQGVDVVIRKDSWKVPPLFQLIEKLSGTDSDEMYRVFNQGIALIAFVERSNVEKLQSLIGEESFIIGEVVSGTGDKPKVRLI